MKLRSPGENLTQSGSGLPPAVVAETCNGVELALWVKVLSGKVIVKAVPGATLTTSKVLTATKLEVPGLLVAPDAVAGATGVAPPVTSTTTGAPAPGVTVVAARDVTELTTVLDEGATTVELTPVAGGVLGLPAAEAVDWGGLNVTSGAREGMTDTVIGGLTTSC